MINKYTVLASITVLVLAVMTSIASRAMADDPSYTQGYNTARDDFLHNRSQNDSCDPNNGDAFCAGYKIGYAAGWAAAGALYGNQVAHQ